MTAPSTHSASDGRALAGKLGRMYGLRIIQRWGWDRTLRTLGVVLWVGLLAHVALVARPDLLVTADFGSDTSNYAAFGERLADRGPLYQLSPGDRPVPADNAPVWTVPILSPPQMAVPWAALSWAPDVIRFYGPWVIGLAGTIAVGILFMRRAPAILVLITLPMLNGLAVTAWSGNVNALIGPIAVLAWWAGQPHVRRGYAFASGVIAAAVGAVKIGPTLLWAWLVGRRPAAASAGGLLAIGVLTGTVLLLLGTQPFADYVRVALGSTADPSDLSLVGTLTGVGLPPVVARIIWLGVVFALGVTALLSGRRPVVAMVAAAAGLVLLTPIVRSETVSVALVVAGTPWVAERHANAARVPLIFAACVAVGAAAFAILSGGLDRSGFAVDNTSDRAVIVRFSAPGQSASWGYLVPAHAAGIGWSDLPGGVLGPVRVFDETCALLTVTDVPRGAGTYRFDGAALVDDAAARGTGFLAYDKRCSAEMPTYGRETR